MSIAKYESDIQEKFKGRRFKSKLKDFVRKHIMGEGHLVYGVSNYFELEYDKKDRVIIRPVEFEDVIGSKRHMFSDPNCKILSRTHIDDLMISTVFLHMDHNMGFGEDKRPVLFESMIFYEPAQTGEVFMTRYKSYKDAILGHRMIVSLVFSAMNKYNHRGVQSFRHFDKTSFKNKIFDAIPYTQSERKEISLFSYRKPLNTHEQYLASKARKYREMMETVGLYENLP